MTVMDWKMDRRALLRAVGALGAGAGLARAWAAGEAPDVLIGRLSNEVLDAVRKDPQIKAGDVHKIVALVDKIILPHLDFKRMTAASVGPGWRKATPEQQQRLQQEFKTLLVRTYAGALAQVKNETISVKPLRAQPTDTDVLVRTEVRGRAEPVQLDYRLEKTPGEGAGWKIYNLNVMGVWLVETYRNQFTQEINTRGVDGLLASLAERNAAGTTK